MSEQTTTTSTTTSTSTTRQPAAGEPDWAAMTDEDLRAFQIAENARRSSPAAQAITGAPHPGAVIGWREVVLADREVRVRVYRPVVEQRAGWHGLPLVLHVHGGGFVGTAVQSDWVNSHLAAELPAVVVSVEHRLLGPDAALAEAAADGREALEHIARHAAAWGVDPARIAVFGESCGALVSALAAISARDAGLPLAAQVLVNPAVDVTDGLSDYDSIKQYPYTPTLTLPQLEFFRRLALRDGDDPRALSPLYADSLKALAPALVVVPTRDPLADQGRRYAEQLRAAGTTVRLTEYPDAGHAFLSMPGVVPQADPARTEILAFLRETLAVSVAPTRQGA